MFRGEFSLSLDAKGRVAVPSRYRERLAEACAGKVSSYYQPTGALSGGLPISCLANHRGRSEKLPALDVKAQAISHLLIGHATECDMDTHGRVLIPQSLRDFAGLDKQVKMVGQVHKFEFWAEDTWTRASRRVVESSQRAARAAF